MWWRGGGVVRSGDERAVDNAHSEHPVEAGRDTKVALVNAEVILRWLHHHGAAVSTSPVALRLVARAAWLTGLVLTSPTAYGHRSSAVARFWLWQVWRRISARGLDVQVVDGTWLWVPPWSRIGGVIAALGTNEPCELAVLADLLSPGDLVVDVGANIGTFTVALAAHGAQVVAFEPAERARDALQRSVERNDLTERVRVLPVALHDQRSTVRFVTGNDVGNRIVEAPTSDSSDVVWVDTDRLDTVVEEHPDVFDRPISVLKIDAEGADKAVLRGALATLSADRPVVMVETWGGGSTIRDLLASLGYDGFLLDGGGRGIRPVPADWRGQANLLFVHRSATDVRTQLLAWHLSDRPLPRVRVPRR